MVRHMERSQRRWLYISVGFSLLVLIVILYFTINQNTLRYIRDINPVFLLLAFLTHILTMCFWAMRVKKMSGSLGYHIGFFYSLNLIFANLLAAAVTPAQAGERYGSIELYKANVPIGDATAVVIMERVLDGIALAALAAFAMIVLTEQWNSLGAISTVMVYVTWIFVAGCLFLFYLAVRAPGCCQESREPQCPLSDKEVGQEQGRGTARTGGHGDRQFQRGGHTVRQNRQKRAFMGDALHPPLLGLGDHHRLAHPRRARTAPAHS